VVRWALALAQVLGDRGILNPCPESFQLCLEWGERRRREMRAES
jgi:hypothetical protein